MATIPYVIPNHGFCPVQWTEIKISRSPQTEDLDTIAITEQHILTANTPLPATTNWDDIDPVTGLSKECMTAMDIIDSCNYAELRRFNAPRLADQTITIGQQIEMYHHGGDSETPSRERKEKMREKGRCVVEKIAAITAIWKRARSRKAARGG